MRQNILLVALSALTVASAQNQGQNFTIDKSLVDPGTKAAWCNAQYNSCSTLCFDEVAANRCNNENLEFDCECKNGTAPGLQYYSQTMPTQICLEAFKQCINENVGDSRAQDACETDILANCGKQNPADAERPNSEPAETTSGDSPAPTETGSESDAQNDPSTSTSTGAAAPTNAAYIGNGVAMVAAGVFAALL